MLQQYWNRIQAWVDTTIEKTATKRLTDSVNGRALKRGVPLLSGFLIAVAVLVAHLLLLSWPEPFSAYLLTVPAIAVLILSGLSLWVYPSSASRVPSLAVLGYVALASLHSVGGALASTISPASLTAGHRQLFAFLMVFVVLNLSTFVTKKLVRHTLHKHDDATQDSVGAPTPSEESEYVSDEDDHQ